jgi:hypothetical protein
MKGFYMNKQDFFKSLEDMPATEIARRIKVECIATFDEVMSYVTVEDINFTPAKRKEVKANIEVIEIFIEAMANGDVQKLEELVAKYPESPLIEKAKEKLAEIENEKQAQEAGLVDEALRNINLYTPEKFIAHYKGLGYDADGLMKTCCSRLNVDYNFVRSYDEPKLIFGSVPEKPSDIPCGFTDIFFWGTPSSGKTCALATFLNTMQTNYTPTDLMTGAFGWDYWNSLVNLFHGEFAYLPPRTVEDRTQYMPFHLKKQGDDVIYNRNISFFELSGELFKYIYDVVHVSNLAENVDNGKNNQQKQIVFKTLDTLLNSDNQKIHFFFIDYSMSIQDIGTQRMHLNAAATYFKKNNIFQRRTDAIYIVLTKADLIPVNNIMERRQEAAKFLHDNFSAFVDDIKAQCRRHSINRLSMKIFSIGDVYFSKICKINREYSRCIIDELLQHINPAGRV